MCPVCWQGWAGACQAQGDQQGAENGVVHALSSVLMQLTSSSADTCVWLAWAGACQALHSQF